MEYVSLTRDFADIGVSVTLQVPGDWLEYQVDGVLWCLGHPDGSSIAPNLTLTIDETTGAEDTFRATRSAVEQLDSVEVSVDQTAERNGLPSIGLGYAYLPTGGATLMQVVLCSVVEHRQPQLAISAVGTCPGSAPEETIRQVSEATSSMTVTRTAQSGGPAAGIPL